MPNGSTNSTDVNDAVVRSKQHPNDFELHTSKPRSWASSPAFHLVYLLFYFVPWLFQAPTKIDVLVAAVSMAIYIPLHYRCFSDNVNRRIGYIIVMELLAFATAPFHGTHGVFHIYASVQAGYLRPAKYAFWSIGLLALAYALLSLALETHWLEAAMVMFLAAVIGISSIAGAEQIERQALLERSRALDQQIAANTERERIARDLHDLLGHALTMVALKCEVAEKLLDTDPARARKELREIRDASRVALKDVRAAVTGMNITTINTEIEHAKVALKAAGIHLTIIGEPPSLDAHQSKVVGLAMRETVTNIIRHSFASNAVIEFTGTDDGHSIRVKDDGRGGSFKEGSGLYGLRQRIEKIGGTVDIEMTSGAHIQMRIPHTYQVSTL